MRREYILAGDVGGTNTRIGLFNIIGDRLHAVAFAHYGSRKYDSLNALLGEFLNEREVVISKACLGIAGPVVDGRCETPNLPWSVYADDLGDLLQTDVALLNDLEAHAHSVSLLGHDDLVVLHAGHPDANGNAAIIAAGTGLGEAGLHREEDGFHPFASEGGHADFAPRDELQIELLRYLLQQYEHVSVERVLSGPGLCAIYRFLMKSNNEREPEWLTRAFATEDAARVIARSALAKKSPVCVQALQMFASIYGAEAGNLALKMMATGGVFLSGGIAPKIIDALKQPEFLKSFYQKGRMSELLLNIPIKVIMNERSALLGAAHFARTGRPMSRHRPLPTE